MNKDNIEIYLIIIFTVVELLSMIFNFYFVTLYINHQKYYCNFSVIFFCLGFFIVDIVADYFSPKEANQFFYYKIYSQTLFLCLGNSAIYLYHLEQNDLTQIFHKSPLVIAAGLVATYLGFNCTSKLMSFLKVIYQGNSTFKRYLFSTLPGEIVFSFVFTFLCFYQFDSLEDLYNKFMTSIFIKIILTSIFATVISFSVRVQLVTGQIFSIFQKN